MIVEHHFRRAERTCRGRHVYIALNRVLGYRGQHSHHRVDFVVHLRGFPHNVRIAAEFVFPILVAQNQYRWRAELVVVRQESSPHQGTHSEKVKVICRHNRCSHAIGISMPIENERHCVVFDQARERLTLLAIILDLVHRKTGIVDAFLLCLLPKEHKLLSLRIR